MVPRNIDPRDRIILPLDVPTIEEAGKLVNLLSPYVGCFKLGLELIWSAIRSLLVAGEEEAINSLSAIRCLSRAIGGRHAFIDAKLCDIPNTVKGASIAISSIGVRFFNVHASAGVEAIKAAVANKGNSDVLGVTVLTSIAVEECVSMFGAEPDAKVYQFAQMLCGSGADGIICSPKEIEFLRSRSAFDNLLIVTPGVRPAWAGVGDQKRVMTPYEAIEAGADYLVIGRPITKPPVEIGGPVEAAVKIAEEIASALKGR